MSWSDIKKSRYEKWGRHRGVKAPFVEKTGCYEDPEGLDAGI